MAARPDSLDEVTDPELAEAIGKRWLADLGPRFPRGSILRGRYLLRLILAFGASEAVCDAYFQNLAELLAPRRKLAAQGRLVIGLGSGRCGSTTLTHLITTLGNVCATHENPPMLYWSPEARQIATHLRRFALLRQYFPLVFDAAHWWLNAVPELVAAFPEVRFVGLVREEEATVHSFLTIKGVGRGSWNHWVAPGSGPWRRSVWDFAYPHYPLPKLTGPGDGRIKAGLVRRYVHEYNAAMTKLAAEAPDRMLTLRTEELGAVKARRRLYDFIGAGAGTYDDLRLNTQHAGDGDADYWF